MRFAITIDIEVPDEGAHGEARAYFIYQYGQTPDALNVDDETDPRAVGEAVEAVIADIVTNELYSGARFGDWRIGVPHVAHVD